MLPIVPAKVPRSNAFVLLDIDLSGVALLNGPRPTLLLDLQRRYSGLTHWTWRQEIPITPSAPTQEAWNFVLEDPEGRILRNTTGGDFTRIAHAEINGMPTSWSFNRLRSGQS
jgi:hypothetical protein